MVAKRAWWYQVVDGNLGHTDVDDCAQVISNPQTPPPTEHQRSADCDGAIADSDDQFDGDLVGHSDK